MEYTASSCFPKDVPTGSAGRVVVQKLFVSEEADEGHAMQPSVQPTPPRLLISPTLAGVGFRFGVRVVTDGSGNERHTAE